jgi:hypothetical protein
VESIDERDILKLKLITRPSTTIVVIFNAISLLLGQREYNWSHTRSMILDDFHELMKKFNATDNYLDLTKIKELRTKYTRNDEYRFCFERKKAEKISKITGLLIRWIDAVDTFVTFKE